MNEIYGVIEKPEITEKEQEVVVKLPKTGM